MLWIRLQTISSIHHIIAWRAVSSLLGGVLLIAAMLKGYDLASIPSVDRTLLDRPVILTTAIGTEIVLAGFLLTGTQPLVTWCITFILLSCYFVITVIKAVSGVESCGCFGNLRVSPWITAIFDLLAVAALVACRHGAFDIVTARKWAASRMRWALVAFIVLVGAAPGAFAMLLTKSGNLNDDSVAIEGTVVLQPSKWIGKPFPLVPFINIGASLSHGTWIIVLFRSNCEHCKRAIPRYEELAKQSNTKKRAMNIALVEMPPYESQEKAPGLLMGPAFKGRLTDARDWFAQTPMVLLLSEGLVTATLEGEQAEYPESLLEGRKVFTNR